MKKGFSLIEMLVYITLLSFATLAVVNTLLLLGTSFNGIKVAKNINTSASTALERIEREIRNGVNVNVAQSTFDTNPGTLSLTSEDESGTSYTMKFYLSEGRLMAQKDSDTPQPLTLSTVSITNFTMRRISTAESEAVKIEMTASTTEGKISKSENFYAGAILRGSYHN